MSSFKRRTPSTAAAPPPGTHLSASTPTFPLVATGVPSLDDLLGGGLPLGSILLVLAPDTHSAWSRLIERYWIAQGLVVGHRCAVTGELALAKELVNGCMWIDEKAEAGALPESEVDSEGEGLADEQSNRTKIAWRYEKMKKYRTTVTGSSPLTLTSSIPAQLLTHLHESSQITYLDIDVSPPSTSGKPLDALQSSILQIQAELASAPANTVTRLAIHSLGSLDWASGKVTSTQIHRYLHSLKTLLRPRNAVAVVTLPSALCRIPPSDSGMDKTAWIKSLSWAVDACIEMQGFADDPNLSNLFPHSHGLLTLHSFPTRGALLPATFKTSTILGVAEGAGENNLAFKLKRKRLVVETLHLGVEGGVGERRTEPATGMGSGIELGSGVGMRSTRVEAKAAAAVTTNQDKEKAETTATSSSVDVKSVMSAPDRADTPIITKPKTRARVRFGEDSVAPTVEVSKDGNNGHGHGHGHGQGQGHEHGQAGSQPQGQTTVRHDRMDLYEF